MASAESALEPLSLPPSDPSRRGGILRRLVGAIQSREARIWRWSAACAAALPLVGLAFVICVLAVKGWPAIKVNGLGFLTRSEWNPGSTYGATTVTNGVTHPVGSSYGAWPLIAGTLQTSAIAVVVAVPLSIAAAIAITEWLPNPLAKTVGLIVELLAGIPSVIIGLWGVMTLGPFLAEHVYPPIADRMPDVPVLSYFRGPTGHGEGLLTSGLVLALMIVPIITATTRDLLLQVPVLPKEGASALGMTDYEVARRISLPWIRSGVIGATVLGLGRALGETIAVAMISGSVLGAVAPNIYGTMTTIAATIVTQLDSAFTDGTGFAVATLAEAALVLAVISVVVNLLARLVINRGSRIVGPVGR